MHQLYTQSLAHTPIIFILSPGSDPTNQLLRYAKISRGSTLHMDIVSLGKFKKKDFHFYRNKINF